VNATHMSKQKYIPWPLTLNFLWGPQRRAAVGIVSAAHYPISLVRILGTTGLVTKPKRDEDQINYPRYAGGSVSLMTGEVQTASWHKMGPVFLITKPKGLKVSKERLDQLPLAIKGRIGEDASAATHVFEFKPIGIVLTRHRPIWLIFEISLFERAYSVVNITLTGLSLEAEGFDDD